MGWVTNVVGSVVLSHQSDGAGFHPQIDVLADENDGVVFVFLRNVVSDIENAVIFFLSIGKDQLQVRVHFFIEADGQYTLAFSQSHIAVEKLAGTQLVDFPDKFPGMMVDDLRALLELIEFLKNRDRDDNIVFLEVVDTGTVMEDDIGIENEKLFLFLHGIMLSLVGGALRELDIIQELFAPYSVFFSAP